MSKQRRKVHFYALEIIDISTNQGISIYPLLRSLYNLPKDEFKKAHFGGQNLTHVLIDSIEDEKRELCMKLRFVKADQFPGSYDPQTNMARDLSEGASSQEGIVETTHCVLYDTNNGSVCGIESSQSGPKITQLKNVLESILGNLDKYLVNFKLCVGNDTLQKLQSFSQAGSLTVRARRENIPRITSLYESIGLTLRQAQEIGNTDWVEIVLGFEMRRSGHSDGRTLIRTALDLFTLNASNNLIEAFDKLEITAKEGEEEQLRPFDLIQEQIASFIHVNKTPGKLKYFISGEIYEGIRTEYRRNKFA
jgi:hypothetical protein